MLSSLTQWIVSLIIIKGLHTKCPYGATSQTPFSAAMELRNKKLFGKIHRIHSHIKDFSDEATQDRSDQNHVWNVGKVELMVRATCEGLVPICNDTEYRAFNGVCNNLENPTWAAANTGFKRLLPPEYEDGIGKPKGGFTLAARTGLSLPTPRFVSQQCTGHSFNQTQFPYTDLFTAFGQFLSHDLSLSPEATDQGCCLNPTGHECFPIPVPSGDSFFSQQNQTCLDFRRTVPFCIKQGEIREQLNSLTSVIDANNVYGSDVETNAKLRTKVDGLMLINSNYTDELLPVINGSLTAGEIRFKESPMLASLHTLFLREHNRLAREVAKYSSSSDDEFIFQTARNILIAEMQSIVYNEYLPILLGPSLMKSMDIWIKKKPKSFYNASVDPSISNSFATASFRFGHSMLLDNITLRDVTFDNITQFPLHKELFNPQLYFANNGQGVDEIIYGLMKGASKLSGTDFSHELTDLLLLNGTQFGSNDLLSRNIQRGRDHGLPVVEDTTVSENYVDSKE
ncbi:lactoperoxidase isoform X2 [Eurytemora carolleeae]|uniref:lactoperoxidase isoform X2 n=1 Tax=Eurytemora carolleeae TaxID=1294199 RepID=UPI000C779C8E|nr:lactoperoxidase isoform X2 [Eurytemora carolleeae]|eukprot:XP_023327499.1 lactoperoxidase-like isoform X2 [Eurytemora affinis]